MKKNINQMEKKLLILILSLLSIQSFAKVGDVYYCEMTQAIELKEGKLITYNHVG